MCLLSAAALAVACAVDVDLSRPGFPCNADGRCAGGLVCVDGRCVAGTGRDGGSGGGLADGGVEDGGALDGGGDGGAVDGGPMDGGTADGGVGDGGLDDGGGPLSVEVLVTPSTAFLWDTVRLQARVTGATGLPTIEWQRLGGPAGRLGPQAGGDWVEGPEATYYPEATGTHRVQVTVRVGAETVVAEAVVTVPAMRTFARSDLPAAHYFIDALAVDPATGIVGATTRGGPLLIRLADASATPEYEHCMDTGDSPPVSDKLALWDPVDERFLMGYEGIPNLLVEARPVFDGSGTCLGAALDTSMYTGLDRISFGTQSSDGRVWIATDEGLFWLDPGGRKLEGRHRFASLSPHLNAVAADPTDQLFVVDEKNRWLRTPLPVDLGAPAYEVALGATDVRPRVALRGHVDPTNGLSEIWIAASREPAVVRIVDSTADPMDIQRYTETIEGQPLTSIEGAAYEEATGDLYFAADSRGLFRYKRDLNAFVRIPEGQSGRCSVPQSVAMDDTDSTRGRRIWIGCTSGISVWAAGP